MAVRKMNVIMGSNSCYTLNSQGPDVTQIPQSIHYTEHNHKGRYVCMFMTEQLTTSKVCNSNTECIYHIIKLQPVNQRSPNLSPHANLPPLISFLAKMLK